MTLDEIVALAKRRGFIYKTSEIYGGLANSYDYGPLGTELLRVIKNRWWQTFVTSRDDMVGLDSQILLHPQTWVASGHVGSFNDPLVEDLVTHKRYRADHLIESFLETHPEISSPGIGLSLAQMTAFMAQYDLKSPDGNPISAPKSFNLLFETAIGTVAGAKNQVYLRGETAQGIFTNFLNVLNSTRVQLPFGIGQLGKSFRNEITTGQFIFRTLEFEQGEIEYFFDPEKTTWQPLFDSWKEAIWHFVVDELGISPVNLRWRQHTNAERSFYSRETFDLEYRYPFGYKELWGLAYRTDYDLKQHIQSSGTKLVYTDPYTGAKIIPHVIEPAVGINRLLLMVLCEAFKDDPENNRLVLQLKPDLAAYTAAVFPLLKNKPELIDSAQKVYVDLKSRYRVLWDDRGNIGKRYYSQDEIGTPFCVTIDFQTLTDQTVTVRHRDTAKQERVACDKLIEYIDAHINQYGKNQN